MTDQASADKRKYVVQYVGVFVIAVALRFAYVAFMTGPSPLDTDAYLAIAQNLVSGHGFALADGSLTAYRPPGYPVFIAAIQFVTGHTAAVLWIQSFLQAGVVFVAAWLARAIIGDLFALAAATIVAVDPYLVGICGMYMTECLFTVMVALSFALVIWAMRSASPHKYLLAGLGAGAASATRPEFMVFIPAAIAVAVFWGFRRSKMLCLAVFVVASMVLPSVWAARNNRVFGEWIFATTHGGYTHRLAYNEVFYDEVVSGRSDSWSRESLVKWQASVNSETAGKSEPESDAVNYAAAREFVREDYTRAARVALYEMANFWLVVPHSATGLMALGLGLYFLVLVGLAAVGVYVAWRSHPAATLVVVLLAAETIVHMYYWSDVRMRIPFHPLLAVMAAVGLATLFGRKIRIPQPIKAGRERALYSPAA
jgi:4-amino-4-deoxy-L-arabinose transferase-like glycosyltransferase